MKEYRNNELLIRQRIDTIYLDIVAMYIVRLTLFYIPNNMIGTRYEILLGV